MKIGSKLLLLAAVFVLGFGAFWFVAQRTMSRSSVGGPVYERIVMGKDLVADILPPPMYIIEAQLNAKEILAQDDPALRQSLLERASQLRKDYDERTTYWREHLETGELRTALLDESGATASAYFALRDAEFIPAIRANNTDQARAVAAKLDELYTRHRASIVRTVDLANAFSAQAEKSSLSIIASGSSQMLVLGVLLLGVVVGLSVFIRYSIVRSVNTIVRGMLDVAHGRGDLTLAIKAWGRDEMTEVASSMNLFIEALHDIMKDLVDNAKTLRENTDKVLSSDSKVSVCIEQQSARTREIHGAIEEMSKSIADVAKQSGNAAAGAANAGQQAQTGGQVVAQTVKAVRSIADEVQDSAKNIEQLAQGGQRIGELVTVINDIADQTNLLALNAAIEAARAGEHGRGFAVVADEVRKLADRTTKATGEIASTIDQIRADTDRAVQRMHGCIGQVRSGVELAEQAGQALDQINEGARQTATLIQSIAAAAEQQASTTTQMNQNIQSIVHEAEISVAASQQAALSGEELLNASKSMQQLIGAFRLTSDRRSKGRVTRLSANKSPEPLPDRVIDQQHAQSEALLKKFDARRTGERTKKAA